jgi:hypothetical protein
MIIVRAWFTGQAMAYRAPRVTTAPFRKSISVRRPLTRSCCIEDRLRDGAY